MANIVGGLRARLIRESLYEMLHDALNDLDWFNTSRPYSPITFDSRSMNQNEQIAINTAALSDENMTSADMELGSQYAEHKWEMYIDFFAESDALGLHFARDVKDILEGRFITIGNNDPSFDVYDYTVTTPYVAFRCQIEDVTIDRAHGFVKPWLEHWYAISFIVIDRYGDESY